MKELLTKYYELRKKICALQYVMYVIGWDSETEAPNGCFEERSKHIGVLSEMDYNLLMSKDSLDLINALYNQINELPHDLQVEIKKLHKEITKKLLVPSEKLIAYEMLIAKASPIWAQAKVNNDYKAFVPTLTQIVTFLKEYIKYVETSECKGYNVLLDEFEEGSSIAFYDNFFDQLRKEIVPLVKKIQKVKYQYKEEFASKYFDIPRQKLIAKYIMKVMCFDENRGLIKESVHPFTSGYGTTDVRITTHYYENMVISSIFSVIHELGHATYEQQCDPKYDTTLIGGGTTMAMHESQSRFYENIIGRSKAFWETHYHKLLELYPDELSDVTIDDFYHYVNKVECSLVRTEADELTYPLHIMVRYELEKALFEDKITVDELPQKWNELYKEYLGIDVPTDTEGVLQDIHWANGSFGYFPTYALGSAYASQLYYYMQKDINIDESIKEGDLSKINAWLKEKVHKYGGSLTPKEILVKATNEEFNPTYYVKYLKEKYTKLYNL